MDYNCESDNAFFYTKENHLISGYLKLINDDGSINNQFQIITRTDSIFYIPDYNFISYTNEKGYFPMVKFAFPFMELKFNVIPYMQTPALIKFLYLLDKVKFRPRVSDGMRTNEAQLLYKRRGWSNIEASPHIIGAAMDLAYTPPEDKAKILSLNDAINVHYLEHGHRGNRHVHIQDNSIWNMDVSTYANDLSAKLNAIIKEKICMVADAYSRVYKKTDEVNSFIYNFHTKNPGTLKIKFYDMYGKKKAELLSGVYEPGNHSINVLTHFLNTGIYKVIITNQEGLLEEKIIGVI
ncbi:MAG: T9SS type A sorting domain-containing protein [Bacteroidetes bacterium]|nr:T9SS type A sorting domain-containing protein [Bacteroidota bacterium]